MKRALETGGSSWSGSEFRALNLGRFQPPYSLHPLTETSILATAVAVTTTPSCRGCRLMLETNGLKALYFQGVVIERFQRGVDLID